jgi:HEAT repeat protein
MLRVTPPPVPLRRLGLLLQAFLVAAVAFGAVRPAVAADAVRQQVDWYKALQGRFDDMAYEGQREAADALADLGSDPARGALRSLITEERGRGRAVDRRRMVILLSALVRGGGPAEAEEAIRVVETEHDAFLSTSLARILASTKDEATREWLRGPGLRKTTPPVRAQVARALGSMADPAAVVPLLAALREDDLELRAEVLLALGETKDPEAFASMAPFLSAPDPRLREVTARALGALACPRGVPVLIRALDDPEPRVAESASSALASLDSPDAVEPLIDRLAREHGKDQRLSEAFERALGRLTGATLGDDPEMWRAWWKVNRDKPRATAGDPSAPQTAAGPRYYGLRVRSSRVVFVVDVSRSMGWNERLDTAKDELLQTIRHLAPGTRFDVVTYSDKAEAWAGKLVPATPENVRRAARHVQRLEPQNATNIVDGLRAALKNVDVDTIFFLSDGTPTAGMPVEPDEILAELREANRWRRVRIHTVALLRGEPPGAYLASEDPLAAASFMKRVAAENDGEFREVR